LRVPLGDFLEAEAVGDAADEADTALIEHKKWEFVKELSILLWQIGEKLMVEKNRVIY